MNKIKAIFNILSNISAAIIGVVVLPFYLFVYPYLIASKNTQGIIYLIVGFIVYTGIILLTIEMIVATFGDIYNLRRKTILFSPTYKDGTPKPESGKPTAGLRFFIILLSYFFIIHVYAIAYLFAGNYIDNSFDKANISFIDAFFLSFTSITVGPSGIQPNSILTKIIVMTEIFWGFIYTILVFSVSASLFNRKEE